MTEPEFMFKKGVPANKIMANKNAIARVQHSSKTGKASLVDYDRRPKKKMTFKELVSLSIGVGMVACTLAYSIHILDELNDKNMAGLRNLNEYQYNISEVVENADEKEMLEIYDKLVEILTRLGDEKAIKELKDVEFWMEQITRLKTQTDRDYTREITSYWSSILIIANKYNLQVSYTGMSR